jgi:hypothetical protein
MAAFTCWWRRFLLLRSSVSSTYDFTLLGATDEALDEVHILCNDCLIDAMGLEVTKESNPRWVDASRCKAFLWIITHVRDMDE